jgi:hypothetical protein
VREPKFAAQANSPPGQKVRESVVDRSRSGAPRTLRLTTDVESLVLPPVGKYLGTLKKDIWAKQTYAAFATKVLRSNSEEQFDKERMDDAFRWSVDVATRRGTWTDEPDEVARLLSRVGIDSFTSSIRISANISLRTVLGSRIESLLGKALKVFLLAAALFFILQWRQRMLCRYTFIMIIYTQAGSLFLPNHHTITYIPTRGLLHREQTMPPIQYYIIPHPDSTTVPRVPPPISSVPGGTAAHSRHT